jgi:hypothetical protein
MTEVRTKLCKTCGKEKPLSEFYLKQRDDYAHECLGCRMFNANKQQPAQLSLSEAQALLEIDLLNTEAHPKGESSEWGFVDVVTEGLQSGIPADVLTRMKDLWEVTAKIGGELIQIGKIILIKLVEFLRANPKLTASLALGAAVYFLTHAVPVFGPILAPLFAVLATAVAMYKTTSLDEVVAMAKQFFQVMVEAFNAVAHRWAQA